VTRLDTLPQEFIQRVEPGSRLFEMEIMTGMLDRYPSCRWPNRQHAVNPRGINAPGLAEDEQRRVRQ